MWYCAFELTAIVRFELVVIVILGIGIVFCNCYNVIISFIIYYLMLEANTMI